MVPNMRTVKQNIDNIMANSTQCGNNPVINIYIYIYLLYGINPLATYTISSDHVKYHGSTRTLARAGVTYAGPEAAKN
jgi:hypothetical protein